MNKKQRNRKDRLQNERNRLINRRYLSTMRSLSKMLRAQSKLLSLEKKEVKNIILLSSLYRQFSSIVDKSVKKNILHKNTAARKKSAFSKILN